MSLEMSGSNNPDRCLLKEIILSLFVLFPPDFRKPAEISVLKSFSSTFHPLSCTSEANVLSRGSSP
jgi:hypothetical protein